MRTKNSMCAVPGSRQWKSCFNPFWPRAPQNIMHVDSSLMCTARSPLEFRHLWLFAVTIFDCGARVGWRGGGSASSSDPPHPHLVGLDRPLLKHIAVFQVQEAVDGRDAVEKASAWTPELVLMDLRMPRLGGLEATEKLKRDKAELKVVAVTANAFEEDRAAALAAGCDDFVRKPFLAADILKCLNQHLGLQRGRTPTHYEAALNVSASPSLSSSCGTLTLPRDSVGTLPRDSTGTGTLPRDSTGTGTTSHSRSDPPAKPPRRLGAAPDAAPKGQCTPILLADDVDTNRKLFLAFLKRLDLTADAVVDGEEALQAAHRKAYGVVFMDVHMPRMDGIEATRRIRREVPESHQPVIVALTATDAAVDAQRCLDSGMNYFMSKPFTLEQLRRILSDIHHGSHGKQQGRRLGRIPW